jgi:hypothetical protein
MTANLDQCNNTGAIAAKNGNRIKKMTDAELDSQASSAYNEAYGESYGSDYEAQADAIQRCEALADEQKRRTCS